jgi:hypothetical protein
MLNAEKEKAEICYVVPSRRARRELKSRTMFSIFRIAFLGIFLLLKEKSGEVNLL